MEGWGQNGKNCTTWTEGLRNATFISVFSLQKYRPQYIWTKVANEGKADYGIHFEPEFKKELEKP